jgi:hypothetical protein
MKAEVIPLDSFIHSAHATGDTIIPSPSLNDEAGDEAGDHTEETNPSQTLPTFTDIFLLQITLKPDAS